MIDVNSLDLPTLISGFVGVLVVMISAIWYLGKKSSEEELKHLQEKEIREARNNQVEICETNPKPNEKPNKSRKNDQWKVKSKEGSYEHSWLITTLKGHTSQITAIDFAQDGKKFVSVSSDRSAYLWNVKDFSESIHKSVRHIFESDTPTKIVFAPDCKSLIASVKRDNKLCVYKLSKRDDGNGYKISLADSIHFPSPHTPDISAIGISSSGRFLMSASPDVNVSVYDLRGNILKSLHPKMASLFDAIISPDGKFIATCGFTPDVFVYEVHFDRDGNFQDVKKAFDLKGHASGVYSVSFNQTGTRAVTVSKDGYWRIFDTEIRYAQGQEATILRKGEWSPLRGAVADRVRLAMSPSGGSFAVSVDFTLKVFSSEDENKSFSELVDVHSNVISCIRYSPCGSMIATTGDKFIRIFHNVPEYHSTVVRLTRTLPEVSGDVPRRRIRELIEEATKELNQYTQ